MKQDPVDKIFAYLLTISLIVCILASIYIAYEVGKEISDMKSLSNSNVAQEDYISIP